MYLIHELQQDYQAGKKLKFLYFWGHQASADGSITKSCISQWWKSQFIVDGVTYSSAEHFMMAEKARLFQDHEILEQILASNHPKQAKELGRKVRGFNHELWTLNAYDIVVRGNFAKFSQNKRLEHFLIGTQNRVLVEASPVDKVWGIGMSIDHESIGNPMLWKGQNLLGFALMDVRQRLLDTVE
ncbi:MAG: NADAR family protein [Paenibacillus sp.]|nr:NADAR family protein [Paenibacillus sp.]